MTVTKKEVKTIFTIELSFNDYAEARERAASDEFRMGAFDECDIVEDTTVGTIRYEFENLQFRRTAKTLDYIIRKLGFDGVTNYGYYNKYKKAHVMEVYNYGDCMN